MTSYVDVFGGDTVPPSDNRYVAVALTANTTFYWPEQASGPDLMADIMEVTPDAAWDMTFPAANVVSTGRDVLVRNLGSDTITLKDSSGGTIGTVAAGVSKYLYITDNSTAAGLWTVFTFGTGTSAADAATLAGYGLVATGSTLSQQYTVTSTAVTTTILATTDRARTIVFTNSGTVTCNLPSAATAGNGFFVNISNQGTGTVTLDGSGGETIDGEATKDLAPGESCTVVCNAVLWASIGYGRSTQFQFTKLVLDISVGSPFTLTSVQAQNKLIQTIGTITGAVVINVPAVVAVYYIQCSHTGAFSTTFKTAAGGGVALSAGDRSILYCDGVDVVQAQTATAPAANLSGGSAGAVVYQSATGVTSFTAVGSSGEILVSGGTGVPTWSAGTGSGVPVRATSATLVTPNLGTPASGTLTNCTGLPQAGTVGLTTADSPRFTGINLGHASDTTLTRVSAGVVAVEGSNVLLASGLGSITQAYDADIPTVAASQGEMEAGTEAALRSMSPLRIAQAIAALGTSITSVPVGGILIAGPGATVNSSVWLACDGQKYLRSSYTGLSGMQDSWTATKRSAPAAVAIAYGAVSYGGGNWVALSVGDSSASTVCAYSSNGTSWSAGSGLNSHTYNNYTCWMGGANNLFLALPLEAANAAICSSPTGATWTSRALPASTQWSDVWSNTAGTLAICCAIGTTQAASSVNGTAWTTRTTQTWPSTYAYGNITWNQGAGLFLVFQQYTNTYQTTADGITYALRTLPIGTHMPTISTASGGGRACASSATTTIVAVNSGRFYSTTDGINWLPVPLTVNTSLYYGITYTEGMFWVTAVGNPINNSSIEAVYTSADEGVTWCKRDLCFSTIAGNGSGLIAGSTYIYPATTRTDSMLSIAKDSTYLQSSMSFSGQREYVRYA